MQGFIFLFLVLIKGIRKGEESTISLCYRRGFGSFPSAFSRARWRNLMRVSVDVKPMMADLEVYATLGGGFYCFCFFYSQKELCFTKSYLQFFEKSCKWLWGLRTLAHF